MYDRTGIVAVLVRSMLGLRRSFDLPTTHPLFDKIVITEIEAKTMRKQQAIADLWLQKFEYDRMSGLMKSRNCMSSSRALSTDTCVWSKENHECEPSSRHQTLYFSHIDEKIF